MSREALSGDGYTYSYTMCSRQLFLSLTRKELHAINPLQMQHCSSLAEHRRSIIGSSCSCGPAASDTQVYKQAPCRHASLPIIYTLSYHLAVCDMKVIVGMHHHSGDLYINTKKWRDVWSAKLSQFSSDRFRVITTYACLGRRKHTLLGQFGVCLYLNTGELG